MTQYQPEVSMVFTSQGTYMYLSYFKKPTQALFPVLILLLLRGALSCSKFVRQTAGQFRRA